MKNVSAIVCNHTSALDILAVAGTGVNSAISKAGIAKNPLFGPTIRVTRSYLARAGGSHQALRERIQSSDFPPLGVFPSGTTTNQKIITRFRTGIFIHDPKVQIMTLEYKGFERLSYLAEPAGKMIKNLIFSPLTVCKVTYYDDIYTKNAGEEPQDYANRIGEEVAKKVGGQYIPYDYKEVLWFNGEDSFRDSLTDRYKKEQLWRGQWNEWVERCTAAGLEPFYNWTQEDLDLAAAKKKSRA